jgi:hypothetical protein
MKMEFPQSAEWTLKLEKQDSVSNSKLVSQSQQSIINCNDRTNNWYIFVLLFNQLNYKIFNPYLRSIA